MNQFLKLFAASFKSAALCAALCVGATGWGREGVAADVFDKHTSDVLQKAVQKQQPLKQLSMDVAGRLKTLSPKMSAPCIVMKTNDGGWAKAMIGWGFRKGTDKPIPVLVLERFVTYRSDRTSVTTAAGREVMLFAGFSFDLDIGQVVPEGQGGDVRLDATGVIHAIDKSEIYTLDGSQLTEDPDDVEPDPNDHEGVLPRDFGGSWTVDVDGRWKGELDLVIDDAGRASGTYRSDESQSVYDVTGRVSGLPHRIRLNLQLDNATQTFDAYLWTKDKSALAGTATLAERTFGFYALRRVAAKKSK